MLSVLFVYSSELNCMDSKLINDIFNTSTVTLSKITFKTILDWRAFYKLYVLIAFLVVLKWYITINRLLILIIIKVVVKKRYHYPSRS